MSEQGTLALAKLASESAAMRPTFLGFVLGSFQAREGFDDTRLSRWLGIDEDQLYWLRLCRRPRIDNFAPDVNLIANRFRINPSRLAALIREVDAVDALRITPGQTDGVMAAARDHETSDETAIKEDGS